MKIYVDFTNGIAFYDDTIHAEDQIPSTAKEISQEIHNEFINNQHLKTINPETLKIEDKPPCIPTVTEIAQTRITELKNFLTQTDYKIIRQLENETMPPNEFEALKAERQAVRDEINELEEA